MFGKRERVLKGRNAPQFDHLETRLRKPRDRCERAMVVVNRRRARTDVELGAPEDLRTQDPRYSARTASSSC
jgi:hypothetical protein